MRACQAVLNVAGAHYGCELDAPHPGLAHANGDGHAIWCSDGEARRYKQPKADHCGHCPHEPHVYPNRCADPYCLCVADRTPDRTPEDPT